MKTTLTLLLATIGLSSDNLIIIFGTCILAAILTYKSMKNETNR